ncbi:MAG: 4-hydroxyphenylpyruvate dioxygenase [Rhodospirillales bacterium]|nr:4-hydroxyphenylpyruvate dioxygenase [Rhodospirillales bacterium]MCB9996201.1 4-hydroxyphenylpyruvate dioxygenase [Rhodospirillales bacterium]
MADLFENPLKTDGFEFVEFTGKDIAQLEKLMDDFGFTAVAQHKERDITLYQQHDIKFLINREKGGQPGAFADEHTGGASAMAFRVQDAGFAYAEAKSRGADVVEADAHGGSMNIPAIKGIGGTLLYLIDSETIYDGEFQGLAIANAGCGLTYIDHLTHNVMRGNMDKWAQFYESIFNFREIRYFDIEGKLTGLKSRAMTSPCGKIRIPLNESSDDKSQIEEFLRRFNGEGIQHIALGTGDIYKTVDGMKANGVPFQDTPDTYYEKVDTRVPGHGEDLAALKEKRILVDGAPTDGQGLLLQIFTQDEIGPVFFEIIQRKGNEGFGEGNFQALFESIELDQIRRGVLEDDKAAAE